MIYREAGQFKTSYQADNQIFPIRQDRLALTATLIAAVFLLPYFASPYILSAIMIPFLIFALAALGLNILTGYAGQLSLGTAAFMAVGAFASYNFMARLPGLPLLVSFILGGLCAAMVGIAFGLPSLRIRGFYLAASTPIISSRSPAVSRHSTDRRSSAAASCPAIPTTCRSRSSWKTIR